MIGAVMEDETYTDIAFTIREKTLNKFGEKRTGAIGKLNNILESLVDLKNFVANVMKKKN